MVTTKRTNKQPSDPRASLLLYSEKAVFCKKWISLLLMHYFSSPSPSMTVLQYFEDTEIKIWLTDSLTMSPIELPWSLDS